MLNATGGLPLMNETIKDYRHFDDDEQDKHERVTQRSDSIFKHCNDEMTRMSIPTLDLDGDLFD